MTVRQVDSMTAWQLDRLTARQHDRIVVLCLFSAQYLVVIGNNKYLKLNGWTCINKWLNEYFTRSLADHSNLSSLSFNYISDFDKLFVYKQLVNRRVLSHEIGARWKLLIRFIYSGSVYWILSKLYRVRWLTINSVKMHTNHPGCMHYLEYF